MLKQNITLIGMAGAGKTTVGKKLAEKLGFEFIDIDEIVVTKEGASLPKIINKIGEKAFIELEEKYTLALGKIKKSIISPSGSSVYSSCAMNFLKEISTIIFLDVDYKIIEERILCRKDNNIIGLKEKGIKRLFLERHKLYEKYADFSIQINSSDAEEIADRIVKLIKN
jgi:shikimate kinase